MFDLAWNGKGLILNLREVPDQFLEQMVGWANEKIEAQNDQLSGLAGP